MAENENGQEKTEQPTAKRLNDAREKGQIARSREFNTFMILIVGGAYLLFFGSYLGIRLSALMTDALTLDRSLIFDPGLLLPYLRDLLTRALLIITPLFAILMAIALFGPILIGGFNFSTQALAPKFSKVNPITGMKRVFSVQGLVELFKALGKFTLVLIVAWLTISAFLDQLLALGEHPVERGIIEAGRMALWTFILTSAALILVAAIDVPFQLWNHNKQLKMTLQEIKDEFKESDGKPEVKGRIRQLQMEMAQRRMMGEVPKADVVITNPTHFAVAIAYEPGVMRAPRLLAKGIDDVAAAIRALAEEHGIMRVEAPRVARAIYFTTDLKQEIPGGLFVAVARILAYVYQIRREDADVDLPDDLPVPDEYLDPHRARQARSQE
ncbi:flagellar biosynthesis protein FlhB [Thiobaca trueperi]|uniref:Flagellar biosynthetic protein FlhB n=1 Tax=Thiobaca trueperi TaxID=127458 RepID=A0A4R3MXC3_9GAMM|nr:flagellar biosynthesis protein FlhB [Thiobaca trueperi]TCT21250.1 flagellar biosynthetic protein FlhB [Thiobaca trueperi]